MTNGYPREEKIKKGGGRREGRETKKKGGVVRLPQVKMSLPRKLQDD